MTTNIIQFKKQQQHQDQVDRARDTKTLVFYYKKLAIYSAVS